MLIGVQCERCGRNCASHEWYGHSFCSECFATELEDDHTAP